MVARQHRNSLQMETHSLFVIDIDFDGHGHGLNRPVQVQQSSEPGCDVCFRCRQTVPVDFL